MVGFYLVAYGSCLFYQLTQPWDLSTSATRTDEASTSSTSVRVVASAASKVATSEVEVGAARECVELSQETDEG